MSIVYKNWKVHNLVAHPLMEVLSWIGLSDLGDKIHDATYPAQEKAQ